MQVMLIGTEPSLPVWVPNSIHLKHQTARVVELTTSQEIEGEFMFTPIDSVMDITHSVVEEGLVMYGKGREI